MCKSKDWMDRNENALMGKTAHTVCMYLFYVFRYFPGVQP